MFGKNLLRVVLLSVAIAAMSMAQPSSQASHTSGGKNGSYYPLAVGNWWLYRERGYAGQRVKITRFEWYVDSISEGHAPGYLVWPRPMEYDDVYLELLIGEDGSIFESGTKRLLLKNSLHAGERWTSGPADKPAAFEVVSAGRACARGGRKFGDCAVIREADQATDFVTVTTYARGVGPVSYVYLRGLDAKKLDSEMTIRSWHVKSGRQ
jgi:hypothetical protein